MKCDIGERVVFTSNYGNRKLLLEMIKKIDNTYFDAKVKNIFYSHSSEGLYHPWTFSADVWKKLNGQEREEE